MAGGGGGASPREEGPGEQALLEPREAGAVRTGAQAGVRGAQPSSTRSVFTSWRVPAPPTWGCRPQDQHPPRQQSNTLQGGAVPASHTPQALQLKSINKHRPNSISMKASPNSRSQAPGWGSEGRWPRLGRLPHLSGRDVHSTVRPGSRVPPPPRDHRPLNVRPAKWGRPSRGWDEAEEDRGLLGLEPGDGLWVSRSLAACGPRMGEDQWEERPAQGGRGGGRR